MEGLGSRYPKINVDINPITDTVTGEANANVGKGKGNT